MPKLIWLSADNKRRYVTTIVNDPNVPAGYVLTNTSDGSGQIVDGKTDGDLQTYVGGLWSGGYPAYDGNGDKSGTNGHLGGN